MGLWQEFPPLSIGSASQGTAHFQPALPAPRAQGLTLSSGAVVLLQQRAFSRVQPPNWVARPYPLPPLLPAACKLGSKVLSSPTPSPCSLQAENELWLALALTHPAVSELNGAQLAAFLGALLSAELVKRPITMWETYTSSEKVSQ